MTHESGRSWQKAFGLATLLTGFIATLLAAGGVTELGQWLGLLLWCFLLWLVAFSIFYTRKFNPWRYILFLGLAVGTIIAIVSSKNPVQINWIPQNQPTAGSPLFICHIALAGTLGSLVQNYLSAVFSSQAAQWRFYYYLAIVYLLFTLLLGTGWCSWACGYGAWDNSMARLAGKKRWKLPGKPKHWIIISGSIFVSILLLTMLEREALFCRWICPFKLNEAVTSPEPYKKAVQIGLMIFLGIGFILILPLLTGKRTFCLFLCPFGVWQRWIGKINPFSIVLNHDDCNHCGTCSKTCPMGAITIEKKYPVIHDPCNRCGQCMDECPKQALSIGWRERHHDHGRLLFSITALLLTGVIGGMVWIKAGLALGLLLNVR